MWDGNTYKGCEIEIEELPSGCIVSSKQSVIRIASKEDALALIDSLSRMIEVQFDNT